MMQILMVDDEVSILEQAKIFLKRKDDRLDIDTATSAEEALQKLSVTDYDAIVSDYQMPGMDGLDLLKTLRKERESSIPFIILTGRGDEDVAVEALNNGANSYLRKGSGSGKVAEKYSLLAKNLVEQIETDRMRKREDFLCELLRHDLPNKLQTISFYYEIYQETEPSREELEDYIEKMGKETNKIKDLVEKINVLKNIGQGETRQIQIDEILERSIEETEPIAHRKGIEIEYEGCEGKVLGDLVLKELFINLIENSIRHSKCKTIKIRCEDGENHFMVIVEDDGKGITDQEKDEIFDKGFTTDQDRGSGLGMYLVHEILETFGGEIEVKDSELAGARFDVGLQKV